MNTEIDHVLECSIVYFLALDESFPLVESLETRIFEVLSGQEH